MSSAWLLPGGFAYHKTWKNRTPFLRVCCTAAGQHWKQVRYLQINQIKLANYRKIIGILNPGRSLSTGSISPSARLSLARDRPEKCKITWPKKTFHQGVVTGLDGFWPFLTINTVIMSQNKAFLSMTSYKSWGSLFEKNFRGWHFNIKLSYYMDMAHTLHDACGNSVQPQFQCRL